MNVDIYTKPTIKDGDVTPQGVAVPVAFVPLVLVAANVVAMVNVGLSVNVRTAGNVNTVTW